MCSYIGKHVTVWVTLDLYFMGNGAIVGIVEQDRKKKLAKALYFVFVIKVNRKLGNIPDQITKARRRKRTILNLSRIQNYLFNLLLTCGFADLFGQKLEIKKNTGWPIITWAHAWSTTWNLIWTPTCNSTCNPTWNLTWDLTWNPTWAFTHACRV